jgi:hypothetical protein
LRFVQILLPEAENGVCRIKHEDSLIFAFDLHASPRDAPSALLGYDFKSVLFDV